MQRRFTFRLGRVLRVREIAERSARALWGQAQAALRLAEAHHEELSRALALARASAGAARSSGRLDVNRAVLDDEIIDRGLQAVIAAREMVLTLASQAAALEQSWKAREKDRRALSELEERARRAHAREVEAVENAEMDEIAGMRNARERIREGKKSEKRSSLFPSTVDTPAAG